MGAGKKKKLTPMLAQYLEIKGRYPDCILFYRMGDFYEMFFEDASLAAPILGVQLTSRDKNSENPIPMCGVPHHSVTGYLNKLLLHGKKVALCEQVEDPAAAKGLVRREVLRVLTPALIGDPDLVPEDTRNILCAIDKNPKSGWDLALLDLLGGRLWISEKMSTDAVQETLFEFSPREMLTNAPLDQFEWWKPLAPYFPEITQTLRSEGFKNKEGKSSAHQALMTYLEETQKMDPKIFVGEPEVLRGHKSLRLDPTTQKALEILRTQNGTMEGATLLNVLDATSTPMGRRLLKDWLIHPLQEKTEIEDRLDAVELFRDNESLRSTLEEALQPVRDLERLASKTALGLGNPRDLVSIRSMLESLPQIQETLLESESALLRTLGDEIQIDEKLLAALKKTLVDEPPVNFRDGNMVREDYSEEVSELKQLASGAKSKLAEFESQERSKTGIPNLRIKFSKVFGYTIEVSKSHISKVPKNYIRKQTIAQGERYYTEELKVFEEKIISAEHKLKKLEERLFLELRTQVSQKAYSLIQNSRAIAQADVLLSFAKRALDLGYHKPEISSAWDLEIKEGRHPVVESLLEGGDFVPNDVLFHEASQTHILTGPNMAGKSTIMRQVALITLMAHVGSFVPAAHAKIPIVDAIFTRIGSSDDLAHGRSTFMVEMSEVATILQEASDKSLILIDEIGRGTSTYDGLSLAWSLLEYIHQTLGAKTLFATHFHELTALEKSLPGLANFNVLVDKWQGGIVFLHKLAAGPCSQSYGIEVAKLASLPGKVLTRAKEILGHLESQSERGSRVRGRALQNNKDQMLLFTPPKPPETRAATD